MYKYFKKKKREHDVLINFYLKNLNDLMFELFMIHVLVSINMLQLFSHLYSCLNLSFITICLLTQKIQSE